MKIAYILSMFPKLSESFVLNEIVGQLKNGNEIFILSLDNPTEHIIHDEFEKYMIEERTYYFKWENLLKISKISFLKFLLSNIVHDLLNLNVPVNSIQMTKYPINSIKIAYFATIFKNENIDLIHTHFAPMGYYAYKLSNLLKIPYTLTTHAYDIYKNPNNTELKKIMNEASSVITISEYNKNYLANELQINSPIEVVRCGIEHVKFNNKERGYLHNLHNSHNIKILSVARFVEKKGLNYLIKSIPLVTKEFENCEFIIVGSGELEESLIKLTHDLNVENYVSFEGNVSDSKLLQYYSCTDIFVLPCIIAENGDRDGIPVSIMEAMSLEIPVISTTVSGIPELIDNKISGILIPPKDEKSLSEAIIELCHDKNSRILMGKEGRKVVLEKFNLKKEAGKLSVLFRDIVNE